VPPGGEVGVPFGGAVGQIDDIAERGFVEPVKGEDPAGARDVLGRSGVAGRGEGEEFGRQFEAEAQHGQQLQGFEGGAGVEGLRGVSGGGQPQAFGVDDGERTVVDAFDEVAAGHLDERDVVRCGVRDRFRHRGREGYGVCHGLPGFRTRSAAVGLQRNGVVVARAGTADHSDERWRRTVSAVSGAWW
jgi:hypothetical protein